MHEFVIIILYFSRLYFKAALGGGDSRDLAFWTQLCTPQGKSELELTPGGAHADPKTSFELPAVCYSR